MGSNLIRAGLGASVGLLVLLAAAASRAEENKGEAKRHFEAGLALAEAEDFAAAAVEFEASVALYPTKMGLFNLANCYKALHRYAEALDVIVRLRTSFEGKLDADMEREVAAFEGAVTALVGRLELKVDPDGAAVLVDGKKAGVAPFPEPLLLAPGDHEIRVELPGYRTETRKVHVVSRGNIVIVVGLVSEATAAPGSIVAPPDEAAAGPAEAGAPGEPGPADEGGRLGPAALITAGALAVGFGVATIALGVKAGDKEQEAVDAGDESMMDYAGKLQTAGRVMLGLTGAAVATAVVLVFFTDFRGSEKEADEGASLRSPRSLLSHESASIWFADGGGGIAVGGRF